MSGQSDSSSSSEPPKGFKWPKWPETERNDINASGHVEIQKFDYTPYEVSRLHFLSQCR